METTHNAVRLEHEDNGNLLGGEPARLLASVAHEALHGPPHDLVLPRQLLWRLEEGSERLTHDPVRRLANPGLLVGEGDEGLDDLLPVFAVCGRLALAANEHAGADEGVEAHEAGKEEVALLAGVGASLGGGRVDELREDARCEVRVGGQEAHELREGNGEALASGFVARGETGDETLERIGRVGVRGGGGREGQDLDELCGCVEPSCGVVAREEREEREDALAPTCGGGRWCWCCCCRCRLGLGRLCAFALCHARRGQRETEEPRRRDGDSDGD